MAVQPLDTDSVDAWLTDVASEGHVVVFKHSPICAASLFAAKDVRHFTDDFPSIPVYQVNVVAQRPLSQSLAQVLGVRHASPQLLWLDHGQVVWSGSHDEVTYDQLRAVAQERQAAD